jgi:transcriptional regulator with XRE-family HTH domain
MPSRLAQLRAQKENLSQLALADLLGVTKQTVSRWERGVMVPRQYFIIKLCKIFGCEKQDLGFRNTKDVPDLGPQGLTSPDSVHSIPSLYDSAIPLPPAVPLVGREQGLARIREELCHTSKRVTVTALHGPPGVGKTSLAIALVHEEPIRASFGDGILWAGLGPTPNMSGLLDRWGALLGLGETFLSSDIQEKCKQIRTAIGMRSLLLVLDDVWQLSHAHVLLSVGGPNCRFLITTRLRAIAVNLDTCPKGISELNEEQSIDLLRQLSPEIVEDEPEKVHHLVHTVGGLPLALKLLGNYLRKESYHVPARRRSAAFEHLEDVRGRFMINEPLVQPEAHPSLLSHESLSLDSVCASTFRLLRPSTQETLYALSVFPPKPESFSESAALIVTACSISELDELVDAGLLEVQGADHYRLHPIIADYARQHLDKQTERIVRQRLRVYQGAAYPPVDDTTTEEIAWRKSASLKEAVALQCMRQVPRRERLRPVRSQGSILSLHLP